MQKWTTPKTESKELILFAVVSHPGPCDPGRVQEAPGYGVDVDMGLKFYFELRFRK